MYFIQRVQKRPRRDAFLLPVYPENMNLPRFHLRNFALLENLWVFQCGQKQLDKKMPRARLIAQIAYNECIKHRFHGFEELH
jgi:hypothetical protein